MFHISASGSPVPCKATVNACPRGGGQKHFEDKEQALAYIARESNPVGRAKPAFDYSAAKSKFLSAFKLDEGAKLESKNKGEFCEIYVPFVLAKDQSPIFAHGSEHWDIAAMRLGVNDYIFHEDEVFVETAGGTVAKVETGQHTTTDEVFKDIYGAEARKKTTTRTGAASNGNSYASTRNIQEAAVALGFTDGLVPKAPSAVKPDLIAWDTEGRQHRISVKSYLSGSSSATAILNAAQASSIDYSAPLPEGMTAEAAEALAAKLTGQKSADVVAELKRHGVRFNAEDAETFDKDLSTNLNHIHPDAEKVYKEKLLSTADKAYVPQERTEAYKKMLTAFATRMTPKRLDPEREAITDFATVHPDGKVIFTNFSTVDELDTYIHDRAELGTGSAAKVSVRDGKLVLNLTGQAALTRNKRTTR